jgi:heme-degrading monooxygenase HmoA
VAGGQDSQRGEVDPRRRCTEPQIQANPKEGIDMRLREMDEQVTYAEQLQQETGPIVLVNQFNVAPEDADRLLAAWAEDAAWMKQQSGFISTQLHRGVAGSAAFINVAVWESARALGAAFSSPEFQANVQRYPESTVAAPHVFEKVAVPGICVA